VGVSLVNKIIDNYIAVRQYALEEELRRGGNGGANPCKGCGKA
jgi:hypothetical protein